jgi:hypothetical protein
MDVALLVQLKDPLAPVHGAGPIATETLTFRASAGAAISATSLPPGKDGRPFFGKPVAVGDTVLVDIRFLVLYQNDLGPIIGAAINEVIDLALDEVPLLPSEAKKHLHVRLGESMSEEYGRQNVLVKVNGDERHLVTVDLFAPETIRGVYMKSATGTSAPVVSRPTVFVEEGEAAARVTLEIVVSSGKKAVARKRTSRATAKTKTRTKAKTKAASRGA